METASLPNCQWHHSNRSGFPATTMTAMVAVVIINIIIIVMMTVELGVKKEMMIMTPWEQRYCARAMLPKIHSVPFSPNCFHIQHCDTGICGILWGAWKECKRLISIHVFVVGILFLLDNMVRNKSWTFPPSWPEKAWKTGSLAFGSIEIAATAPPCS